MKGLIKFVLFLAVVAGGIYYFFVVKTEEMKKDYETQIAELKGDVEEEKGANVGGRVFMTAGDREILNAKGKVIYLVGVNKPENVERLRRKMWVYSDREQGIDSAIGKGKDYVERKRVCTAVYNALLHLDFLVWEGRAQFKHARAEQLADSLKTKILALDCQKSLEDYVKEYKDYLVPTLSKDTKGLDDVLNFNNYIKRVATTDPEGKYLFKGVTRGEYMIYATWESGQDVLRWYIPVSIKDEKDYTFDLTEENGIVLLSGEEEVTEQQPREVALNMTEEEVLELMGPPDGKFDYKGYDVWTYQINGEESGSLFVYFGDGQVRRVSRPVEVFTDETTVRVTDEDAVGSTSDATIEYDLTYYTNAYRAYKMAGAMVRRNNPSEAKRYYQEAMRQAQLALQNPARYAPQDKKDKLVAMVEDCRKQISTLRPKSAPTEPYEPNIDFGDAPRIRTE